MAEKSILAYFKSPEHAEKALKQLQALSIADGSIERIDGYPGDGINHSGNPVTSSIPGLGYLTLGEDVGEPDAGILSAANVSASGYSSGEPENRVTGYDILLTVVIEEKDYDKALKIVQSSGAL